MAQELNALIDKHVSVITNDGKNLVGVLAGIDRVTNIVLKESVERIFSMDYPVRQVPIGLYIIRGDNIALIGELDKEADEKIDYDSIKVLPMKPVVH
mmetsp:Transcript_3877/g.4833  ORF Transcript_3877/g.4833 Transcript_3877/m.4833 type:complete len:97 (-) Transcript_3877:820-1110(-)